MINLEEAVGVSPFEYLSPQAINDLGHIGGSGFTLDGGIHAMLLIPILKMLVDSRPIIPSNTPNAKLFLKGVMMERPQSGLLAESAPVEYPIASGTNLVLQGMEVVQVVQDLRNSVPLFADKTTVVRTYLAARGEKRIIVQGAKLRGFRSSMEWTFRSTVTLLTSRRWN